MTTSRDEYDWTRAMNTADLEFIATVGTERQTLREVRAELERRDDERVA